MSLNSSTASNKRHLFKNAFTVSSQSVMRGSDVKKLKQKIMNTYKNVTSDQIDLLINKKKDVGMVKLSNKIQLISHENNPIFFDYYDTIYPTIYTFFKIPTFLTTIYIYAPVFQYIESGADLMFQGILNKEDVPKNSGSLVSICLKGSNYPIAYGETIQSLNSSTPTTEYKGKAISIITYLNDKLWEYGSKKIPDDFKKLENENDDDNSSEEDGNENENGDQDVKKETVDSTATANNNTTTTTTKTTTTTTTTTTSTTDNTKETINNLENLKISNEITKEEMDEILLISFLGAIKKGITDSELPMVLKTVFTKHMLYYQPKGRAEINIKKSSYKKVSVFLKEMEKQQFIELKEPSPGNIVLTKIYRNNQTYSRFKLGEIIGPSTNNDNSDNSDNSDNDNSDDDNENDAFGTTEKEYIQIKSINELYSIPKQLKDYYLNLNNNNNNNDSDNEDNNNDKPISKIVSKSKKYYLANEIQKLVSSYIIENKLEDPVKRSKLRMDSFLNNLVPSASKLVVGGLIEKNQFFNTLKESTLKRYLEIKRVDNSIEYKEFDQISIKVKKIANRFVILVTNLDIFGIPIKELANEGQKLFAASTSIEKLNTQKSTLKIQGNDCYRVSQHIQKKYNIPKKYILEIEFTKNNNKK